LSHKGTTISPEGRIYPKNLAHGGFQGMSKNKSPAGAKRSTFTRINRLHQSVKIRIDRYASRTYSFLSSPFSLLSDRCFAIFHVKFHRMNLYVSNLDFKVSEEDLRGLFTPFGTVSSAKVITDRETGRSRGFGFVEMDVDADAGAAMDKLHNQEVSGRQISVVVAREKSEKTPKGLY
jgi:hypothetical protein